MKLRIVIFIMAFIPLLCIAQRNTKDTLKAVTTTGVFDSIEAKSGYAINGYYVEMTNEEFKKYRNKKVKVTGKLEIVPGLSPEEMKHEQGSTSDRKFIVKYRITVLK